MSSQTPSASDIPSLKIEYMPEGRDNFLDVRWKAAGQKRTTKPSAQDPELAKTVALLSEARSQLRTAIERVFGDEVERCSHDHSRSRGAVSPSSLSFGTLGTPASPVFTDITYDLSVGMCDICSSPAITEKQQKAIVEAVRPLIVQAILQAREESAIEKPAS